MFSSLQADTEMVDKIAGILLIVALGMCVVAFPFVMWMLFGDNGPRFRPMRRVVPPRKNDTEDFFLSSEDREQAPPGYDGTGK